MDLLFYVIILVIKKEREALFLFTENYLNDFGK